MSEKFQNWWENEGGRIMPDWGVESDLEFARRVACAAYEAAENDSSTLSSKYTEVCDELDAVRLDLAKQREREIALSGMYAREQEFIKQLEQRICNQRLMLAGLQKERDTFKAELAAARDECNKLKEGPSP